MRRPSEILSKAVVRKGLIAAFCAFLLYTGFGFLALPAILKARLPKALSAALHRNVSVKEIRINPFVLSATVRGLEISDRGSAATWISVGEIYANVQLASVFRGGPVLRELRVVRPYANIVRRPDGSYNFTDLIEESSKKRSTKSEALKYSINNIQILDGSVDFFDGPKDTQHKVRNLRLDVPFISNLKYAVDRFVRPSFTAMVNDDNVTLQGRTKPFEKSLDTFFDIDIKELDIPHYLAYLPFRRDYEVPSARLDLKMAVWFSERRNAAPVIGLEGEAALRDVRLTAKDGSPMLSLPEVRAVVSPSDIGARVFRLASLSIRRPEVDVVVNQQRKLNLLVLVPEKKEETSGAGGGEHSAGAGQGGKKTVFSVDSLRLDGGTVRVSDASRGRPFRSVLRDVGVAVDRLSNEKGKSAEASLSLTTEAKEGLSLRGTLSLDPLSSEGEVVLNKVVLGKYAPYYAEAVRFDVERGTLDLRASYRFAAGTGAGDPVLLLSGTQVAVNGLRLRQSEEKDAFADIPELSVRDAALDLGKKEVEVGDFATRKGVLSVRRGTGGRLNVEQLLGETGQAAPPAKASPPEAPAGGAPGKPWVVTLKRGEIDRYSVKYEDRTTDPPVEISLDQLRLQARDLSTQAGRKGTFSFRTVYNRVGDVSLAGSVIVDPLSVNARISAKNLPIGVTQPYYTSRVKIVLTGGEYSADGVLSIDARKGKPLHAGYRGDMFVRNFASVDKERGEDFLKFGTLHLGGMEAGYNPTAVSIREVSLSDFYSRIIVNPDATLNLQGIIAKADADNTAVPTEAPGAADNAAAGSGPTPVRIEAVTLQGGNVNFSDRYIRPNYSANLVGIGGRVTGLSSDPGSLADLDLRGNLGIGAPIEIKGKINPLADPLYLDLQATVDDVDLSPLTPYSGRYAGYTIEKGKLTLNLKYHVERQRLQADNKVFIDQFTFGDAVDSPEATTLPVRLAVALLKDRNGEIHLDIPVSGDLDNPRFRVLGVVWQVIKNLLVKAATSPFALLGAVFGGGGEQLSYLEFEPGQSSVTDEGAVKLGTLAKMLHDRPGLRLEIEGHVDPERDREALRKVFFRRKLAVLKAEDLANAGQPVPALDNVRIDPAEYGKYLARAYRKEKFPKPRTFLGTLKTLPVPEMEKLMMANIQVTDDDLRRLAEQRAQAARDRLVATGLVDPGRIFLVEPKSLAPEKKEKLKDSRVDFRIT
ncbi:MAG: DUF748 domain-containing protein [Verrucomicrobiota bacterium]